MTTYVVNAHSVLKGCRLCKTNGTKYNKYNNKYPQKPLHAHLLYERVKIQIHKTRILFALSVCEIGLGDKLWVHPSPAKEKLWRGKFCGFSKGVEPPEVI
jgi:hypothetical protein